MNMILYIIHNTVINNDGNRMKASLRISDMFKTHFTADDKLIVKFNNLKWI